MTTTPLLICAALYMMTAVGFATKGQLWFAGMWALYSLANVCFAIGSR